MNYERRMLLIIIILILLNIMFASSGCSMLQRASDFLFKPDQTHFVIPETPKGQLWQTIKGMTHNWLTIPVIALGAVAMFNGAAKLGISCIIFGSVNLFMALATSRFGFIMALFGLIGSCAAIAASILAKNKALKEIVFGIQNVKKGFRDDNNEVVAIRVTNAQNNIQTKSTKKIVKQIKNKMKLKGGI